MALGGISGPFGARARSSGPIDFNAQGQNQISKPTYNTNQVSRPTYSTSQPSYNVPSELQGFGEDVRGAWKEKMLNPGMSPEEILRQKNLARSQGQSRMEEQQRLLRNQLNEQGMSGSGFGAAQLAKQNAQMSGDIVNQMSDIEMQNAMLADRNSMNLLGIGNQMYGTQGQLGLGYGQLNQQALRDQMANDLGWGQFDWQRYLDEEAMQRLDRDRRRIGDYNDILMGLF